MCVCANTILLAQVKDNEQRGTKRDARQQAGFASSTRQAKSLRVGLDMTQIAIYLLVRVEAKSGAQHASAVVVVVVVANLFARASLSSCLLVCFCLSVVAANNNNNNSALTTRLNLVRSLKQANFARATSFVHVVRVHAVLLLLKACLPLKVGVWQADKERERERERPSTHSQPPALFSRAKLFQVARASQLQQQQQQRER